MVALLDNLIMSACLALNFVVSQLADFVDEFVDILELAIDGGETDVSDFIDFFQDFHHPPADFDAGNFLVEIPLDGVVNVIGGAFDFFDLDGTFPTGFFDAAADFFAVEVFADIAVFNYLQFRLNNFFNGREPVPALQAFPPPPDPGAFFGGPGVDDFIIKTSALWTTHFFNLESLLISPGIPPPLK